MSFRKIKIKIVTNIYFWMRSKNRSNREKKWPKTAGNQKKENLR